MKQKSLILGCSLLTTAVVAGVVVACTKAQAQDTPPQKYVFDSPGNPYLPLWEHLPDGEPRVFEDPDNPGKYRVYIIGSHDLKVDEYCGADIHSWSAPVEDLTQWRDEGPLFTFCDDGKWDIMFAPDLVEVRKKDGTKEYYLYPHCRGPRRLALVAKSDRPDGPFTPINLDETGKGVVDGCVLGFDPSVFVDYITDPNDPDYERGYRVYGYWGFQDSNAVELDPETMYSVRPGTEVIRKFIPASTAYGQIKDPEGTEYSALFPGEALDAYNFFEASSIRKVGNKYVWIYSGYSGPDYGIGSSNSTLRYAYGDTPLGPWKSGGVLVDSRAPILNEDGSAICTSNSAHNTHGSIEQVGDQWYVFYHRPPRCFGFARQAVVAPIKVCYDETPVAEGGKVVITGYDPYAPDQTHIVKAANGNEYRGAEVTSEGFHIYGLNPYKYYSAGYACYLSDISLMQDSWDIWDNNMSISNVKDGDIVGFKYFGFGGLDQTKDGIPVFQGTKAGNKTSFDLFLTPLSNQEFNVEVWLDGPYDTPAWGGRKLGDIKVPANASKTTTRYNLDVADAVDNLGGKHAIYLKAKGGNGAVLCDYAGVGFSTPDNQIERPVVPTVSIEVDGKAIDLPKTPDRFSADNGLTGYGSYSVEVNANGSLPHVTAKASSDDVDIKITQADQQSRTAHVACTYNGQTKTYNVVMK